MKTCIITGSCGLIGSESVRFFHSKGFKIIGIDDDSRAKFFGKSASTNQTSLELSKLENYSHIPINICNNEDLKSHFSNMKVDLLIHTAAQPSHDWATNNAFVDFNTNALGTLNLLELARHNFPDAVFIFTSTNKVYGDKPNYITEYSEGETRFNPVDNKILTCGIDETTPIDSCKHSLFGVSKIYADLIVQEYGMYFGMKTVCFRGGCLTGKYQKGVENHGFLSHLIKCAMNDKKYFINGYKGKQVRDNIHATDVVSAFYEFYKKPKQGAVYNIGGGINSNCSILESINIIDLLSGNRLNYEIRTTPRNGDHIWYVTDMTKFKTDYPCWEQKYTLLDIFKEIIGSCL